MGPYTDEPSSHSYASLGSHIKLPEKEDLTDEVNWKSQPHRLFHKS